MSTRGAYGFHKDGVDKITYNHYDSYPEGLGAEIVKFCRTTSKEEMNEVFDHIILVDRSSTPSKEQIRACVDYYDDTVSTGKIREWYALLRQAQGGLDAYKDGLRYMIDSKAFMQDSLFCEWAYVINLTSGKLEVYRGFCTTPQDNRYFLPYSEDEDYYNVRLLMEFPLDKIPENWQEHIEALAC